MANIPVNTEFRAEQCAAAGVRRRTRLGADVGRIRRTKMTEQISAEQMTHRWYARPVLFVADVERALHFYEDQLGFEKTWHEGDGKGKVCQVNRAECEIILCEDASRKDKARLFVELTEDGIAELRREII